MDGKSPTGPASSSSPGEEPSIRGCKEDTLPDFSIRNAIQTGKKLKAIPQFDEFLLRGKDGLMKRVPRYRYRPLSEADDIRVFRMYLSDNEACLPGSGRLPAALTGHIVHAKVHNAATFKALSYCWGSIEYLDCIPLLIDGAFGLNVSRSLHDALRTMVEKNGSETYVDVWADQITIDQHDLKERGQQVSLMGSIYRHCSEVVVWFGSSDSNSVKFFHFVDRLKDCDWGDLSPETMRVAALGALNDILRRASISPADTEIGEAALEAVLERKWFWRLWTFQEAVLATSLTFWCGKDCCSLKDM